MKIIGIWYYANVLKNGTHNLNTTDKTFMKTRIVQQDISYDLKSIATLIFELGGTG